MLIRADSSTQLILKLPLHLIRLSYDNYKKIDVLESDLVIVALKIEPDHSTESIAIFIN